MRWRFCDGWNSLGARGESECDGDLRTPHLESADSNPHRNFNLPNEATPKVKLKLALAAMFRIKNETMAKHFPNA